MIDQRSAQHERTRKQQAGRKRKRTEHPGVSDDDAKLSPPPNKKLSPAEKRAAMEARIAEKRRKKAQANKEL